MHDGEGKCPTKRFKDEHSGEKCKRNLNIASESSSGAGKGSKDAPDLSNLSADGTCMCITDKNTKCQILRLWNSRYCTKHKKKCASETIDVSAPVSKKKQTKLTAPASRTRTGTGATLRENPPTVQHTGMATTQQVSQSIKQFAQTQRREYEASSRTPKPDSNMQAIVSTITNTKASKRPKPKCVCISQLDLTSQCEEDAINNLNYCEYHSVAATKCLEDFKPKKNKESSKR